MAGSGRHHRRAISVLATIGLVAALVTVLTPATGVGATVHIYWAHSPGGIGRADINGSNIDQGFISTSRNQNASDVAVDANHIYWSSYGASTTISRADLDGSNIDEDFITLSHAGVASVAVDAAHIYWSSGALINGDHYTIGRANLDGSSVNDENFITLTDRPSSLAVDANHIYWTIAVSGSGLDTIGRADLQRVRRRRELHHWRYLPGRCGGRLYPVSTGRTTLTLPDMWIGGASLRRVERQPRLAPADKDGANGLAVDANDIYWANGGLETIGHALIDARTATRNHTASRHSGDAARDRARRGGGGTSTRLADVDDFAP